MTDIEAITIIKNRIGEMVNNDSVKKEMVKMKLSGKTNDEIKMTDIEAITIIKTVS